MKKHIQSFLWVLFSIWLMSGVWTVSAAPSTAEKSDVEYRGYRWPSDPEGQMYHRFLPIPAPKGLYYSTWLKATANIDDTPEKETVVLMVAETGAEGPRGEWVQAFLLITETEAGVPKKKDFFRLFDTSPYSFEVPTKTIELHSPPFIFLKPPKNAEDHRGATFKLIDLTGDGTLDIWIEFTRDAVAVISFQDGEFRVVFSSYAYHGDQPNEYIDLDNDGIYEIKIPHKIYLRGPQQVRPTWISLYEWDGTAYVLNNAKFYADNDEFLIGLLSLYNGHLKEQREMLKWGPTPIPEKEYGGFTTYIETYEFYMGLTFYYRGAAEQAQVYLQRVAERGKNENYIKAAESILKKLPRQEK